MTTIKEGYDGKPTNIRVYARDGERTAELWIEQMGIPHEVHGIELVPVTAEEAKKAKAFTVVEDEKGKKWLQKQTTTFVSQDTLAYVTLDELVSLRDDINGVIKEIVGV